VLRENAEAAGELVLSARRRRTERVARVPDLVWRPGQTRWDAFTEGLRSFVTLKRPEPKPPPPKRPAQPYLPVGSAERLPILMYHRVAPVGAAATSRWRLVPEMFEEQLAALKAAGCYSVGLDAWRQATWRRQGLQGRPVLLTFDDGYTDFADYAWPLLQRYGFTAVLFVVADRIGGTADWAAMRPEALSLLDWPAIQRLASEGVIIGSHSATHPELTGLDPATAVTEMARSRASLSRGLGKAVDTIAYPHGAQDAVVRHLAGACGYTFGFTCEPGTAGFDDGLLALPRVEVRGDMPIDEFRAALALDAAAEPAHE
jgi:peptidoglycan/xylan/chitin deacetylase (PgdA/CDA1 family)